MNAPLWLAKGFVLALHERLIAEFGGLDGLRDEGLLNSALAKPKNLFFYDKSTYPQLAASYAFGIVRNHPFLDGNKRTAFAAAGVFLETNGYQVTVTEIEATMATLVLAEGSLSEKDYAKWLGETPINFGHERNPEMFESRNMRKTHSPGLTSESRLGSRR